LIILSKVTLDLRVGYSYVSGKYVYALSV